MYANKMYANKESMPTQSSPRTSHIANTFVCEFSPWDTSPSKKNVSFSQVRLVQIRLVRVGSVFFYGELSYGEKSQSFFRMEGWAPVRRNYVRTKRGMVLKFLHKSVERLVIKHSIQFSRNSRKFVIQIIYRLLEFIVTTPERKSMVLEFLYNMVERCIQYDHCKFMLKFEKSTQTYSF